jgi:hypothetical protein
VSQNSTKNEKAGAAVATATLGVRRLSNSGDIQSPAKKRLHFPRLLCVFCVLCGCLLGCLGCSVTRGTRAPDGSLTVVNYRLLWSSEAVDFSVAQPSTLNSQPRFTARLKIGKSATDDEAVSAITAGVVKGLTRP